MAEYIDKDVAISKIEPDEYYHSNEVKAIIEDIPSADIAPVKHGKWIKVRWVKCDDPDGGYWILRCSQCGIPGRKATTFCPHCGAKMNEEEKEKTADGREIQHDRERVEEET